MAVCSAGSRNRHPRSNSWPTFNSHATLPGRHAWLRWGAVMGACASVLTSTAWAVPAGEAETEFPATSLSAVVEHLEDRDPRKLRLSRELKYQKVSLILPQELKPAELLPAIAALLQSRWTTDRERNVSTLERDPAVVKLLREHREVEEELRARAVTEQKARMRDAYAYARRKIEEPEEELEPGHLGRRGVVPQSEPLLRFMETLSSSDWSRILNNVQFVRRQQPGATSITPYEPIVAWPFSSLSSKQQELVRSYIRSISDNPADYPRMAVFIANRGGQELVMGIYDRYWGEALILMTPKGPALRELEAHVLAPVFSPKGPRFSKDLPSELKLRANDPIEVDWRELDYAGACQSLSQELKIPVLADYYTLRSYTHLSRKGRLTVKELFALLHRQFGCWFAWKDGLLLIRRPDWPQLDEREIPEPTLENCVLVRRQQGINATLGLSFLMQLASRISEPQITCLGAFSDRTDRTVEFSMEANLLRKEFPLLRLLAALSTSQRGRFFTTGIPLPEAYRADPRSYLQLVRTRAPWLLNGTAGAQGLIRCVPAPAHTYVSAMYPPRVRPLRLEFAIGGAGRPSQFGLVTSLFRMD